MSKPFVLSLALVSAFVLVPAVSAETQSDFYGPVLGAYFFGGYLASGIFQVSFETKAPATTAVITVDDDVADDLGFGTFISACIDLGGDNLCSDVQGDPQADGLNTLTFSPAGGIPAGANVNTFVFTAGVDGSGNVGIATTGVVTATFS